MNCIKNKLYILLLIAYAFPLGGIGFSLQNNIVAYDFNETSSEAVGDLNLSFQDNGLEQGFNFFIYFDALPLDFAIEYSKELKYQELSTTLTYVNELNTTILTNPSYAGRVSDYFTVRKDLMDLSIPILAKVALSVGGGFNTHKSIIPSISLLNDIYDTDNLNDLFSAAEQAWDSDAVYDALNDNSMDATGLHIQCGVQAKVLMLSAFITAKYTFITKDKNNSIDSFPGFTVGLAYGL
ncbi:hypothetical protein DBW61_01210 [bacterium]|nr:MAG: hypothetical protein CBB66_02610 [bacterium TMED6]RCL87221.1 MAG: hypothetical protein DBW61_01210 [bacterium]|tara:strand:+ start:10690 stop:11403 length:714 start_codon:yes stop_codon:yes gene_type:complete